jgi:hypothetical protein
MFSKLNDVESASELVRIVLVALCAGMLAPAAALAAIATALLMAPVAVVAVPFMLGAFFGSANHEHQAAVVRRSLRPPAGLPALAS